MSSIMNCLFGSSECASLFDSCEDENDAETMHSSETLPAAVAATSGPQLLLQLGRLIIRSRSASPAPPPTPTPRDRLLHAKLLASNPSTSQQIQTQPKPEAEEQKPGVEAQLSNHVQALWNDQIPVCIDVLLAADCAECRRAVSRGEELAFDRHAPRALLLERWTMRALHTKAQGGTGPAFMTSQWLLNAVRSQLHFSQLSAWRATLTARDPAQRRRKLSRETCNIKKIEANCDEEELAPPRRLHVVYSIRAPADLGAPAAFARAPLAHAFPVTDIGNDRHLQVQLETLPRVDEVPTVRCNCPKRRTSKEMPGNLHEELTGKLNDLTLGGRTSKFPTDLAINSNTGNGTRRLSIVTNAASTEYLYTTDEKDKKLLDDRMHTTCSENGKHKCNCDEESDGRDNRSSSSINEPKKLDERRLKEIAKYKRRLRKESKMKKLCDSTSSEGDVHQKAKETHTSIPILQAARFDRFRTIGCYRNQTYLTLPASRIESKSPFIESVSIPHVEIKRTCSVSTQTDDLSCPCGAPLDTKCDDCNQNRLVRSDGTYDLAALDSRTNGARRKCEEAGNVLKKHKCDNNSSYLQCDNVIDSSSVSDVIKRPSLRRYFPIVDRLEKIVADRSQKDMEELHLDKDDVAFFVPKPESKRQKTYSVSEDYVFYEKCDYGTFEKCESDRVDSPIDQNGFKFPDAKKGQENQVPSPSEMDKFRWRFDSAASMVFHRKTGLPLTSSPAPLRRGNNCFDFDDSINGISGIKSALFHPIAPPPTAPSPPASPASPAPAPSPRPSPACEAPPPAKKDAAPKLKMGPSTGLLGSFEESALQGRLEPVATVAGFSAELGASGALCPPHRRLPVTVFFYAPGGTNAPYMGHINLGPSGYRVPRSGTVQVSLFNPHGTLVKMFVVLYDLTRMPPRARTFLRQRTLYLPARASGPPQQPLHKWLRYLIHLRFMTSKSGKLYLHTDIRIIVSRKADLDTATAHSLFRPIANEEALDKDESATSHNATESDRATSHTESDRATSRPNRVFGGSSEHDSEVTREMREIGYENQNGVAYELRSFTYAPENPKYSPR